MGTASTSPRRRVLSALAGLVLAAACARTDDPFEHYSKGPLVPGTGGSNTASGGRAGSTSGGSATAGTGAGGSEAVAGDGAGPPDEMAGASSGGEGPVPPPADFGCGEAPVSTASFTRQALRSAAADCAEWHYCRFGGAADALSEQLAAYADEPSETSLASARAAYEVATDVWSTVDLFQFGPLASSATAAGRDTYQGKGLRELIYAWPSAIRYRVEEQIANQNYLQSWDNVLISGRGLFALDYLLYYSGSDHTCPANSVCAKNWPKLSESEVTERKQAYAAALGANIVTQMGSLKQAWAADGGNFRPLLVDATGYPNEQEAMKVIAWALLFVERDLKDWKLGVPAGRTINAPVSVGETPYSGRGTESIRGNLRGFRRLFEGCGDNGEGIGFDDWLTEAGHPELAQDIVNALQGAQAAADAYPRFADATPAELEAFYQAIKRLTDLLKNDFFGTGSPIGLSLPEGIAGDTD